MSDVISESSDLKNGSLTNYTGTWTRNAYPGSPDVAACHPLTGNPHLRLPEDVYSGGSPGVVKSRRCRTLANREQAQILRQLS